MEGAIFGMAFAKEPGRNVHVTAKRGRSGQSSQTGAPIYSTAIITVRESIIPINIDDRRNNQSVMIES